VLNHFLQLTQIRSMHINPQIEISVKTLHRHWKLSDVSTIVVVTEKVLPHVKSFNYELVNK